MKRYVLGIPAGVLAVIIAVLVIAGVTLGVRWLVASPSGAVQQREQTIGSGSYRIQAYDAFYDDCAAALTTQQNLHNARQQLAAEKDPTRRAQLEGNVTALANTLNAQVNQYNADARKADTRAHFRASDLPYQIDSTQEITCH